MGVKYYICNHCGNMVEKIKDSGVPVMCCGEPMKELVAGTTDGAAEKHVPVYTVDGNTVHVVVGEVEHPMMEKHYIEWIAIHTTKGTQRKCLSPGEKPEAYFKLCEQEELEAVFAYCNLHGLWKS